MLLNSDNSYSYDLATGEFEVRGIPGFNLDVNSARATGNKEELSLTTEAFELALGNVSGVKGDALAINVKNSAPITVSAVNASGLVGYGANTADAADDVGLSISNATFDVSVEDNSNYEYTIQNASGALVGFDGLALEVNQVNVTGNQDTATVNTGSFEIGLQDVGYIKGNGLAYDPSENLADPLRIAAKDIEAFVGVGGGTDEESGIKLSEGELGLVVYQNGEENYALIASGAAGLVGVDDLSIEGELAVRINRTGAAVDETIGLGDGSNIEVKFTEEQKDQLRVEGLVNADVAGNLTFGGEFSMEWFNGTTPGATNQTSNVSQTDQNFDKYQTNIGEGLYQQLLDKLKAEKTRLEAENSTVKSIDAVVDGFAFNEDRVDIDRDRLILDKPHNFVDGQKVIYSSGEDNNIIGGLVDNQEYFVTVIDDTTIELTSTSNGELIDLTSASEGIHQLKEVIDFTATNSIKVDTQNELIFFSNPHGFTNISRVRYNSGNNQAIGGLVNGKDYTVQVVDDNTVKLRHLDGSAVVDLTSDSIGQHTLRSVTTTTSNGNSSSGEINIVDDTIIFPSNHNLKTGDEIQYYRPRRGRAVGGTLDSLLTRQDVYPYKVLRISDTEIKLTGTRSGEIIDLTSVGRGSHVMTLIEKSNGNRTHLTFQSASTINFTSSTSIKLGYNHGLVTGQQVMVQLDPSAAYPESPIAGLEARAYSTRPQVYGPAQEYIYYVKVSGNGSLQFAESSEDLANGEFINLSKPVLSRGRSGSDFRIMPTWSVGAVSLPTTTQVLGNPVVFTPTNNIQVDVESDSIIFPNRVDLKVGEAVEYRSNNTQSIGGLTSGETYYIVSKRGNSLQLAETSGGNVIDLSSAGGVGNHSFVKTGIDFAANNDIAQKRQQQALELQARLSKDLGIQVNLTSGNINSTNDPNADNNTVSNGRQVSFRDINVKYDEQQLETSKFLAGITNAYAFTGTGYNTPEETGIRIDDTNLGLALYKTIDHKLSPAEQAKMTYALTGDGSAALVGVDDLDLEGNLSVQINRTGNTVEETITTPGGEINLKFEEASDLTQISGDASLYVARVAQLEGDFNFKQQNEKLEITGTNISAFAGYGADTEITSDDIGLSVTNANFDLTVNADDSYSYNLTNVEQAGIVGIDALKIAASNISASGDSSGTKFNLNLGNAILELADGLSLSGSELEFVFERTETGDNITFSGEDISAFVGYGSETVDTSDDVGLLIKDAEIELFLNDDESYNYSIKNAAVETRGIEGLTLSAARIDATGDSNTNKFDLELADAVLGIDNVIQLNGSQLNFAVEGTGENKTVTFNGKGLGAFAGYGSQTADTADDVGLAISNADFDFFLNKDKSFNYYLNNAQVQTRGINGLNLNVDSLSAFGDKDNLNLSLINAELGLGDSIKLSGDSVDFVIESDGENQNIDFRGRNLSAFAGYGLGTAERTDDVGLEISKAD